MDTIPSPSGLHRSPDEPLPALGPTGRRRALIALALAMVLVLLWSFAEVVEDHVAAAASSHRAAREQTVAAAGDRGPDVAGAQGARADDAYAK